MVRHTFAAYRDDHPGDAQPIRFNDDRWQNHVPIRLPRTVCIDDERVPAGTAAVLINQSHTDPDLVMSINQEEKRLFDLIDGRCTTGAIAERKGTSNGHDGREHARRFFERLWWYDQVVFDASTRS